MQYVAAVSGKGEDVDRVKEQLLQSNPVLEGGVIYNSFPLKFVEIIVSCCSFRECQNQPQRQLITLCELSQEIVWLALSTSG